jgi:cytochrome b
MTVYVWDFPTRLFHWLLVATLVSQYLTVEVLDNAIQWHFYGGYLMMGLLIFRLLWGIMGAYYARFSSFVVAPSTALSYAKTLNSPHYRSHIGHNPMGAYSVLFVLTVLLSQTFSGLFVSDDIFSSGPYHSAVSASTQDVMSWLHHNMFNAIWLFLILHIGAMIFYKLKMKQDLVKSMLKGYKEVDSSDSKDFKPIDAKNFWLRAVLFAVISACIVYTIVVVLAPEASDDFYY